MYIKTLLYIGLTFIALSVVWIQVGIVNNYFEVLPFVFLPLVAITLTILYAKEGTTIVLAALIAIVLATFSISPNWIYYIGIPILTGVVMSIYQKLWNEPTFLAIVSVSLASAVLFGALQLFAIYTQARPLYESGEFIHVLGAVSAFVGVHIGIMVGLTTIFKLRKRVL